MSGGTKYDGGKPRLDLIPRLPLWACGEVFAFGAEKYSENNWRQGIAFSRLQAALLRHVTAFHDGEDLDPESGLHHLGHAMCCLTMLAEEALDPRYANWDDRPLNRRITDEAEIS